MTVTVRDVIAALEAAYPPGLAESWDAVGVVCGGAGDSLLDAAASARVDAFVTADLRHHPVSEHLAAGGPAVVDVAPWASEHPWCVQAAAVVSAALGGTVDVHVSYRRTDPWTIGAARPAGRPLR